MLGNILGASSCGSDNGGERAADSESSAGESMPLLSPCWLSPLIDAILSVAAGLTESRFEGSLDREEAEVWLGGLADPFIAPAMEGLEVLEGGAIEVRELFAGGRIDLRALLVGVPVLVELPEDAVEPSCLVGDLLGD